MKFPVLPIFLVSLAAALHAAPDRITQAIDNRRMRTIPGTLHHSAQSKFDQGAVDSAMPMNHILMLLKPSADQQADLDRLLTDQQNPASPLFHQWLTPEEFGSRFGLSSTDHSKVSAWLRSEGFTVNESARARNWVAFSGSAGQVSRSLHTSIHRFEIEGRTHFANTVEPSVPEALGDIVGGFLGLNDFPLRSMAQWAPLDPGDPQYNAGSSHFLTPDDYSTIYNIKPLAQAGLDGTGQSIAIVGQSDVLLSDIRAFRTRYGLPSNDPKMILYSGQDPGLNGAQVEGNLDLEWAGAIAPGATLYYIYGPNAFAAIVQAVNLNVAPVVSISYGACEVDFSAPYYRSITQQGNAQGITFLSASGDSGGAGCDQQALEPFATRGRMVDFPAALPEVTGVGGTEFVEGSGPYWAPMNSATFASALSYIPESAWNESGTRGLLASGGGTSLFYPKPAWQTGPGVPGGDFRHVPDLAMSAAVHDGYLVTVRGAQVAVSGTSASAPSVAAIVALLNQYQVSKGYQKRPGLGNINPQLYRLAQSAPAAFHDVALGNNIVPCAQGSPDCETGEIGYTAAPGYDRATGLGSIDANVLVTQWNTATNAVAVTLSTNATKVTLNDMVLATVTVGATTGNGTPTGTVDFSAGTIALGSAPLTTINGRQTATLPFPVYRLGTGTFKVTAQYSGDGAFSAGGASIQLQVVLPVNAAAIVLTGPDTVWPQPADAQGPGWQTTLTLREAAGVPALVTGFTIDGQPATLSDYFPSPDIRANSTVTVNLVFRHLAVPVTRTFVITGVDANGNSWTRQIPIHFTLQPTYNYFNVTATPAIVYQNVSADPSCQWAVQLNVDDLGGFRSSVTSLTAGGIDLSSQIVAIFGTSRLDAYSGLQGRVCFSGITPPASDVITVALSNGNKQTVTVSLMGPQPAPASISAAPNVVMTAAPGQTALSPVTIVTYSTIQPWTASIFPANRTTSWLTVSQLAGAGTREITLKATAAGFEPGVYRATLVLESDAAVPQVVNVPVMFVIAASEGSIDGVINAASGQVAASPGMLLSVFGSNLSNSSQMNSGSPLPYSVAGVSATLNGLAAPVLYASPNQVNLQIPYEAGSGPAVLGINNNGTISSFAFQLNAAAPGIFSDLAKNLVPVAIAEQGSYATLYLTGAGEVSFPLRTAYMPASTSIPTNLPHPVLPLSVTVGGEPAIVQFAGLIPQAIGVMQVNFQVPASLPAGIQPVVVTVGGVASPAVNMTVQTRGY